MALSNPTPNGVSLESEVRAYVRPASPVNSGLTSYGSMMHKLWNPAHSQQQGPIHPRQSLEIELPQLQRASFSKGGKEATTHDFLSLHGCNYASLCEQTAARGLASSMTTQDLLQPLEKGSGGSESGTSVTSHETTYARLNGTLDLSPNVVYRVDRGDFATGRKEEDATEIPRHSAACDTSQKLEVKNNDLKESTPKSTPRSKHSAMEQRRRTKINDRFQMLRQLVPNVDQKRDKASFLLEVIEYVKVLQEKARKYEAAEQSQQQERLKPILWEVCQRNPGCRDSNADSSLIPSVPTVSINTKRVSDSDSCLSPLPATRENEVSGAEVVPSMGQVVALSDGSAARGSQYLYSSSDNRFVISRPIPTTAPAQTPAVTVPESSSCTPRFEERGTPEPQAMYDQHLHHHDKQSAMPFNEHKRSHKRVDVVTYPLSGEKTRSPNRSFINAPDLNCEKDMDFVKSLQFSSEGKPNEESNSLKFSRVLDQQDKEMGLCLRGLENDDSMSVIDAKCPTAEQKSKVHADNEEPHTGHGGVINLSSLYSQGLLDTLTWELQKSGLDLTKATISVQIALGRPDTRANSSRTATSQPSEILEESGSLPEVEPPAKRAKLEADS